MFRPECVCTDFGISVQKDVPTGRREPLALQGSLGHFEAFGKQVICERLGGRINLSRPKGEGA